MSRDEQWQADLRQAHALMQAAPAAAKHLFLRFNDAIADLGQATQIPPRQMAALLAAMYAGLALVECQDDVDDEDGFNRFLDYCHAATHVAVATMRLARGMRTGPLN